jgi:curli production assembly/transport component CsgF
MGKIAFRVMCVAGCMGLLTPALATEQVYHPISPALGGNPNNGTFLLSTAQAQGEGVKSGNQGPDLTPLANALNGIGGTGGSGSGTSGSGGSGSGGSGSGNSGANSANPLATFSGRF